MTREKPGEHRSRASGVRYTGFPCDMARGSAAGCNEAFHLEAGWDAGLRLAGTTGQAVLCEVA